MGRTLTHKEIQALQEAVPGLEVIHAGLAVTSTNYYDPGTRMHQMVESQEAAEMVIKVYREQGYKLNFTIEPVYVFKIYGK